MYFSKIYTIDNLPVYASDFLILQKAYHPQSKAYLEFYSKTESGSYVITVEQDKQKVLASMLVNKHTKTKFGLKINYLFSILGPVIDLSLKKAQINPILDTLFKKVEELAREEKSVFIKIYPFSQETKANHSVPIVPTSHYVEKYLKKLGAVKTKGYHMAMQTAILDLREFDDSDQVLASMKSKWRYNVRLAIKRGISIEFSKDIKYLHDFYKLTKITASRQNFSPWSLKKYRAFYESLLKNNMAEWGIARFEEEIVSIILLIKYGKLAIYNKGASADNHREKMPNHLLHFKTIERLMSEGFEYYDFWGVGIDPDDPLSGGISNFKYGFFPKDMEENDKITRFTSAYNLNYRPVMAKILTSLGAK